MKYTRVTDNCLSRLIIIFIAQSYINNIQISVGITFLLATRITLFIHRNLNKSKCSYNNHKGNHCFSPIATITTAVTEFTTVPFWYRKIITTAINVNFLSIAIILQLQEKPQQLLH